jgi:hypothetical protein
MCYRFNVVFSTQLVMAQQWERQMSSIYPNSYRYVVEFEKLLKRGFLEGLTIKDKIHFISEKDAVKWVDDVQRFDKNAEYINFYIKESYRYSLNSI